MKQDELETLITDGLKLKLEAVRRKNFKGRRVRSTTSGMTRSEKRSAMSFVPVAVKAYFLAARETTWIVSPN
jgi:hypothetical protein